MTSALALLFFPIIMIFAAFSDLFTMTISNRLSLALIGGFFVMAFLKGFGLEQIGYHILAATLILVITFGFFAMNWMGGGDAKLASSTALWFGFTHLFEYVLLATLLGGGLTLVLLSLRKLPMPGFMLNQSWAMHLHNEKTGIPYGIALSAAALMIYQQTVYLVF